MANPDTGSRFRNALIHHIKSWNKDIVIKRELPVGLRFVNTTRFLDIVLMYQSKFMGIEAKFQGTSGTAYQKLQYSLDDCKVCPIPTIIVFSGPGIKPDMKATLVASGYGIEVNMISHESDASKDVIVDHDNLLRQRVYVELGLNWFELYPNKPEE